MRHSNPTGSSLPKADFTVPALLVVLSLIPTFGGVLRLTSLTSKSAATLENARFLLAPAPVVIHIFGATLFCLLGALQFSRSFRLRWSSLHRRLGRVLALAGLLTATTGLWMTVFYAIPTELQGPLLFGIRLAVACAMIAAILIAWRSILRRNVARHEAFMIRAYALGQGAGTQAVVLLPWMLVSGESGGPTRDWLMALSWAINIAVAEVIIARRRAGSAKRSVSRALLGDAASR